MLTLSKIALTNVVKQKAKELGFYACGIAQAGPLEEEKSRLQNWLNDHRNAEMQYMENHFEKRTDPQKLLPGAKSVIVLLYNYAPAHTLPATDNYKISRYAYGTDYHFVIKNKIKTLLSFLEQQQQSSTLGRAFVDSAPVLERSWAQKAGLGWIGKNTCLITKEQGSYFFIGELITEVELEYDDNPVPNHCGGCTRCLDACPTKALDQNGLDAGKCISYLTIEYKGEQLQETFKDKMEDWIFGCDICQEVCPWNRLAEPHAEEEFIPPADLLAMKKKEWQSLDEDTFKRLFKHSPLKRTKFSGIKRNIEFISKPRSQH